MNRLISLCWTEAEAQGIAEYAVLLAVVLAAVVATVHLISSGANDVFSKVASSLH